MTTYIAHEQIGYFCKNVPVTVDKRLKYAPYAQAGVVFSPDGFIHLYSYSTLVCTISPNGFLSCTGTYSQTTRKHINRFIKEFAPNLNYYNAKHCHENNVKMHIETGEIIPA